MDVGPFQELFRLLVARRGSFLLKQKRFHVFMEALMKLLYRCMEWDLVNDLTKISSHLPGACDLLCRFQPSSRRHRYSDACGTNVLWKMSYLNLLGNCLIMPSLSISAISSAWIWTWS